MRVNDVSHTMRSGLQRRSVLIGAAAAALLLAAPGSAFAQQTPVDGGTLRLVQGADAQPKNILAGRAGNDSWRHQVFDALTVLDSETGLPRGVLATDWESSEDGLSFVVRIRDDVTFHTGRPLTAADVVFTLEQVAVPENSSQMRPIVSAYTSIEATGEYEVTITSDTPVAPRVFDLFQLAVIVDSETFSGLADGSQVIGTGPFRWREWVSGASLTLEKNPDYWGEGPYLDAIEISVLGDSTAQANALRGRADMVMGLTPRDSVMFRGDPNVQMLQAAGGQIFPLGLDVSAIESKELRQAIGFALDRQRIIDQLFDGVGNGSAVWWSDNEPGTTEDLTGFYSYDPERARQLIAAAGAEGAEIDLTVIGLQPVPALYEIVQNNLREVGLTPVGDVVETAAFDQGQTAGDLGPAFMQIHGLQGFSAATLVDALPALRDGNPSKFDPPRYRELKDALQSAQDQDTYAAALQELGLFMLDEAFSHVIVHTNRLDATTSKVHGVVHVNVGYLELAKAWLES